MSFRRVSLSALFLLAAFVRPARAETPEPDVQARVAEVLAAHEAKASEKLAEMAKDVNPDAWFVVDELLARKRKDAAVAFAAVRAGNDAPALREFAQRGLVEPSEARPKLASAEEHLANGAWAKALEVLSGDVGIPDGVLRTRWFLARARALEGTASRQDQAAALRNAAKSAQKSGWTRGAVDCWLEASAVHERDHDPLAAIDAMAKAADLAHLDRTPVQESQIRADLAELAWRVGDRARAKSEIDLALGILPPDAPIELRAVLRGRRGSMIARTGDVARGYSDLLAALEVLKTAGGLDYGDTLTEMGLVSMQLDPKEAADWFRTALKAYGGEDDEDVLPSEDRARAGVLSTRSNILIADSYTPAKDGTTRKSQFALAAKRCEKLREQYLASSDEYAAARALQSLAELRLLQAEEAKDSPVDRQSFLSKARLAAIGAEAESTHVNDRVGALFAKRTRACVEEAAKHLDDALRLGEEVRKDAIDLGAPDAVLAVSTALARARLASGNAIGALQVVGEAFQAISDSYDDLGDQGHLGARARHTELFEIGMSAALQIMDEDAFVRCLEAGRAVLLLDALGNRDAVRARGVTPKLERERAAAARAAYEASVALERKQFLLADARDAYERYLAAVKRHESAIGAIQLADRTAAHLLYPQPIRIADAKASLRKDEATVLFARVLGKAHAIVITPGGTRQVEIGDADEATKLCVSARPRGRGDADAKAAIEKAAKGVWARVAAVLPAGAQTIYVSPDGELGLLPYSAIDPLTRASAIDTPAKVSAIDPPAKARAFVFVPSASTLGVLRDRSERLGRQTLAVAISDYTADAVPEEGVISRKGLGPLPLAEEEAREVGTVPPLLGTKVTEEGFDLALAKEPRWSALHIGVHGRMDGRHPLLSYLAFFPTLGKSDGNLTAFEILQRDIRADVVVLGVCESGSGVAEPGEGLVGLMRSFFFGGCPRVVANLWNAEDGAAKAFAVEFHKHWKSGAGLSDAVEAARTYVRNDPKWKDDPYYWAGWCAWGVAR